ncbi:acyltransferase family protein [Lachnospiraceae bacterium SGI.054]
MATKADRYEGIDGLKAYAIIGIALMHVLSNGKYELGGFVFGKLIPNFTNLVFLFMMVSGFGMCCGYYQKIIDRKISVEEFYSKRYIKIWSYFALLCALDFVISPSKNSLYEVFANLTLCQGLLPNANISVIGVSWTLAVIFVFYMLFPFFCFLIGNKKRAWGVAAAALVFNYLCGSYFFDNNHIVDPISVGFSSRVNIVYDAIYFIAGGLIFLYRKELAEFAQKYKVIAGAILLVATVAYFALGSSTFTMLFFCVAVLIYTLGCRTGGVLVNPVAKFLGGISFEIYLCHMVIYRVLEKLHLIHLFENGLLAYIFTAIAVICGSVVFSVCAKWFLNKIETFLKERVNNRRVNHV